jgi:alkanesulfonate monooxygenase SsuD/methylene tetrahydromethanopterin reductase-like flavin-dependent oxidoreductase (luciferase family)
MNPDVYLCLRKTSINSKIYFYFDKFSMFPFLESYIRDKDNIYSYTEFMLRWFELNTIRFGAVLNEVPQFSILPNYTELVELCKRLGLMDHLTWGPYSSVFECWPTLSALAIETSRIHLGPFFLCNSYRNPALVAKMASTLDIISKGRLELGLGAGWKEDEYRAFGYPFERDSERIKRLNEAAEIIKILLSGKSVTFTGKYYQILDAVCKPTRSKKPPIWIGGGGEKLTLRVTAKHADACNFSGGPIDLQTFKRKVGILDKYCRDIGRSPDLITKSVTLELVLGENKKEAEKRSQQGFSIRSLDTRFIGTPIDCIKLLQKYIDLGVRYFMIHVEDLISSLDLFEEEVLPSFQ